MSLIYIFTDLWTEQIGNSVTVNTLFKLFYSSTTSNFSGGLLDTDWIHMWQSLGGNVLCFVTHEPPYSCLWCFVIATQCYGHSRSFTRMIATSLEQQQGDFFFNLTCMLLISSQTNIDLKRFFFFFFSFSCLQFGLSHVVCHSLIRHLLCRQKTKHVLVASGE